MSQVESQAVSYELIETPSANKIAALWMQNSPVNALSKSVRVGLIEHLNTAIADESVEVIVISSKLNLFSGGADISEFSGGDLEPNLPAVLNVIENSPKPVVAVLNGPAFGGGLEVALSCHYRVTFASNKVGLPEVNLGILPGAGGTQRLPRLAGVQQALDMIVSGRPVAAKKLPGVFDVVVDSPETLLSSALVFCEKVITDGSKVRKTCDLQIDAATAPKELFAQYRQGLATKARGFFAPERCIQAVEASIELPFEQGLVREGELFMECMRSKEARAQQHFFFAERAASHVKDFDKATPVRDIKQVGIIGAGTMGGGIACDYA
jgi:3-hydroxyacyl-CoA dehydrogenase